MNDVFAPLAGSEEAGASAPADLSPQGMTSTRALRKMLADWQHRPLFPSEVKWAESWLDIIDITHELQSRRIEENERENWDVVEARKQILHERRRAERAEYEHESAMQRLYVQNNAV